VQTAESGFTTHTILGGMVTVAEIKFVALILAGFLAAIVVVFMKYSRMGQAIRATAQDPRAARVMGINTEQVYAFTFALNAAICGAAGVLISMIWVIQPFYGIAHSIRCFVIVTAAGLGNLPGVIAAGFGLGVAEQYAGFVLGAELQQFTVVALLVLVLGLRQIQQSRQRQVVQ
jgi:branched-chain amino acid transport system permease protein